MRDVTTVVAEEKVNITSVNMADSNGRTVTMYISMEITGLPQLGQVLKKIDGVKGVISVSRVGDEAAKKSAGNAANPHRRVRTPAQKII
jgi:GTP pyrophosphokinase